MQPQSRSSLPKAKVYVEGRYRKLTRDLPQTVFFCPECKGHPRRRKKCERCEGFGKLTRDSVQELVAWVAGKAFGTRKNKFHGSGREDVDVRMLGSGRPFVLELIDPKVHDVDLAAVEEEINRRNEGRLEICGLHWTEKARIRALKEDEHAKEYEALVATTGPLGEEAVAELVNGERRTILQRTPSRVAHRRADKERERWVEFLGVESAGERPVELGEGEAHAYLVRMRTEHGTYVKEILNGDQGKTQPTFSQLVGVEGRCVELDVLAILDAEGEERLEPVEAPPFGSGL